MGALNPQYLNVLLERYLYPLQRETFLSKEDVGRQVTILCLIMACIPLFAQVEILCGDIVQLVEVQKEFFTSLNVCNFCVYVYMCG